MKYKICFLLFILIGLSAIRAQETKSTFKKEDEVLTKALNTTTSTGDSITFRDGSGNTLIKITDEGTVGSVTIPSSNSAPTATTNKLYNVGSTLFFNGSSLGGATSLNDLSDAISDGVALFLGAGAGVNIDPNNDLSQNTAEGINVLNGVALGINNTAIGYESLYSNTYGTENTAVGDGSLQHNVDGNENTAIGAGAFFGLGLQGIGNVALGYQAGFGIGQGETGNVFLGYKAGYNESGDNKLYIENSSSSSQLIWGDFANDRVVINGNSTDNTSNRTFFVNGQAGGTSSWFNDSDIKLKKNIKTIPNALEKVNELRGVNFKWKNTKKHIKGLQMGFIAQEVVKVIPEVVDTSGDHYTMQYAPITALLVEAVKELSKQNEELSKKNKELSIKDGNLDRKYEELSKNDEELINRVEKLEKEMNNKEFVSTGE